MKRILILVGVAAAIIYLVSTPFMTMNSIKAGIESRDTEKLASSIDFLRLRQNLQQQINMASAERAAMMRPSVLLTTPVSFLARSGETSADAMLTPAGLAKLLENTPPISTDGLPPKKQLLGNTWYHYDSLNQVSVHVPKEGEEVRLILNRSGLLSWKLTDIAFVTFD